MKVAVIGAGRWGKNIVQNLYEMDALAAVAEADRELREGLASRYPDVPLHEDYASLLTSDIPAVLIATPAPTHHRIAREALRAGKDVYVEKPFTLTESDAEELIRLASERNRVLMVGHLLLYQPAIQWIRSYLASGKLGNLYSLHQERLNLGQARSAENVLWSLGVHDIAALLYLVGASPLKLDIAGQRAIQPGIEDDVYLHLEFPNGVQAHLHSSWLWPEKRRGLAVIGSEGMLTYDEAQQTVILRKRGIGRDLRNRDEGEEVVFEGASQPLRLELEHFLHCVETRTPPLSDGKNGLEVARVLERASRLLETR
jgi:predicted dehydrogenase